MPDPKPTFLEAADRIGATLCRDALWAGDRCNWLGASMEPLNGSWRTVQRAFGPELYNGTCGIAFFLARLFRVTNDKRHKSAAEGGIRQSLSRLADVVPQARIGFYSGLTGVGYALVEVGKDLDREEYVNQGLRIVQERSAENPNDQGLDVVSGSAGAIPIFLKFYRDFHQDAFLGLAIRYAEHLLATAEKADLGWSWDTLHIKAQKNLTGFSHGTAGIGWALLEIFSETHEGRFREAAEQAFRYERHWFDPEAENWPDFRSFNQTQSSADGTGFMVAWCHGAPGIGLSRLRAYEILANTVLRDEAEAALRSTSKSLSAIPGQVNYSLCHGLSGNAELAIYAGQTLKKAEHTSMAEQVGRQGVEYFQANRIPWPCGVLQGGETPGLMLGLAGIGYFYLRLYDPEANPSILLVTPSDGNNHR